jgi:uncharacterized membrane protein
VINETSKDTSFFANCLLEDFFVAEQEITTARPESCAHINLQTILPRIVNVILTLLTVVTLGAVAIVLILAMAGTTRGIACGVIGYSGLCGFVLCLTSVLKYAILAIQTELRQPTHSRHNPQYSALEATNEATLVKLKKMQEAENA